MNKLVDINNKQAGFIRNELPRRKQRGIKNKNLNTPRGGELNPCPPLAGLKIGLNTVKAPAKDAYSYDVGAGADTVKYTA